MTDEQPKAKLPALAEVKTGYSVMPLVMTDLESAYRIAQCFAKSGMLPKSYQAPTLDEVVSRVVVAMQLGAEVGMLPMQAIQNIAVVNGMPTIWGDAQLALCQNSGLMEDFEEWYEGDWLGRADTAKTFKAVCKVKRAGRKSISVEEFTIQDAIDAGLWSKTGPWQTAAKRMLRYRARAFALRDTFPDVLKGLRHSAEEMEGVMIDVTPVSREIERQVDEELKATSTRHDPATGEIIDQPKQTAPAKEEVPAALRNLKKAKPESQEAAPQTTAPEATADIAFSFIVREPTGKNKSYADPLEAGNALRYGLKNREGTARKVYGDLNSNLADDLLALDPHAYGDISEIIKQAQAA